VSMQAKVLIFLWACKPPKKYSPKIMARDWKASEKNKIVGDNDCYYFGINIWKMSWNCKRSWIDPLGYGDLFSFFFGCGVSSWYRHNYDVTLVAKLSRHRRSAVFFWIHSAMRMTMGEIYAQCTLPNFRYAAFGIRHLWLCNNKSHASVRCCSTFVLRKWPVSSAKVQFHVISKNRLVLVDSRPEW
jgi:hypothetical protein